MDDADGRRPEEAGGSDSLPVTLRMLPAATRRHLLALHDYARYVGELGAAPEGPGPCVALDAVETAVRDVYAGRPAAVPVVAGLAPVVRERAVPAAPLLRLVEAARMDRRRRAYPTFADLRAYCSLAADPMGEMVLQVFGTATPDRVELSDRICTGLRLVRHVRDVTADYHRGRVYLPVEDLDRFGVRPDQLADGPPAPEVRDLLAFQAERASAWLEAGAPLVATLQGWPRLAVSGYLAGARAALDVLARSGYDPLGGLPAPRRRAVVGQWLLASLRSTG